MALWSRLTGGIASFGVGAAAADAISPVLEGAKQQARGQRAIVVLAPAVAADAQQRRFDVEIDGTGKAAVFRSLKDDGTVLEESTWPIIEIDFADDAKRSAVGQNRYLALRRMMQRLPSSAEMLELWRRSRIDQATFDSALAHASIPPSLWPAIRALKLRILDPGQLAAAIHRGLIPDPGDVPGGTPLLKGEQPKEPFNVEAYPVYPIPALDEAQGSGYDRDRLGVLVGLQGLPMGVIEAAQAFYRGILTRGDYIRAFNESNNRNEWAAAVLEYARQIPTARDYIENALRGYRTLAEAQKGAARHGMSADDARLIFQNSGRPLNLHQITQAKAWGAKYNPLPGDDPDPYMNSVLIGSVTPAYYEMQDKLRYNLPSAFFFRVLQQQGVLKEAEAVMWYERLGWPSDLAKTVAAAFAKDTTAAVDPYVAKAETQLWSAAHRSYIASESDETTALAMLTVLGVDAAAQSAIIGLWTNERDLRRKQLTPAQIKKGFDKAAINDATGLPWTHDDALAALLERGYSGEQARSYLNLPAAK